MKKYRIIVAHDNGIKALRVTAQNKKRAIYLVMVAEGCPSYAILSATKIK